SLAFGLAAGGTSILSEATVLGEVNAYVGATAGTTPGGDPTAGIRLGSALDIDAASDMGASARADGGGASAGFTVSIMRPHADAAGTTRAYIGQGVDVTAPGADVRADGQLHSTADTVSVNVAGLASIGGAEAESFVTGTVDAHAGAGAGTTPSGSRLAALHLGGSALSIKSTAGMTA